MAACKIQTGLRLNEKVYKKVKVLCTRERRSLNNLIEYVVQRYIEDYERANGSIPVDEVMD